MADFVLVEEALTRWREAERLLQELPIDSPDRDAVVTALAWCRETYRALTTESHVSANVLAQSHARLAESRAVLHRARRATTKTDR